MADLDIRINKMEKSCLEAAREELKTLKEENDDYLDSKKLEMINDYKDKLAQKYKEDIEELNRDFNKNVFNYEVEEKKKLNEHKKKLVNNIFLKIKDDLTSFTGSRGYKKYLMNNIENTLKNPFFTEKNPALIPKLGYAFNYNKYKKDIEKKFGAQVEKMKEDKIGGCIIVDKLSKISIDNTILTNIEEQIKNI